MGASASKKQNEKKFKDEMFARINVTTNGLVDFTPTVLEMKKLEYRKIHDPGFYGEWSRFLPKYDSPQPRYAHFTAYDEENQIMYVGYGIGNNKKLLSDVWGLNLNDFAWYRVPISDIIQMPKKYNNQKYRNNSSLGRSNSSACFYNGKLYIFGGFVAPSYTNNIHTIDVKTGKITHLDTSGDKPPPMSSCIIACFDNKLFLWGGFDRTYHTDLFILSLQSLAWVKIPTNLHGRTSLPYTIHGKDIYSYGGSDNGTVLHIDLQQEHVEELPPCGACPPNDAQGTNLTSSQDYVFWLGGRSFLDFDYLFMMRKKTNKWSVLHLRPDNETVFVDNGKLDSLNLFALPHMEEFSIQYNENTRCIISTLGKPVNDRPFINVFDISEAMAFVHMRDDMCDMLRYSMDVIL